MIQIRAICGRAVVGITGALAVFALTPAAAQPGKLEAAYVVLGGDGTVARAVLTGTAECPAITLGGVGKPMSVRAAPDSGSNSAFPVLVCEAMVPPDIISAAVDGRPLPLPKPSLRAIAVLGDTGCRLKSAQKEAELKGHGHDHHPAGQFQDCDRQSKWPFSQLSRTVAARTPDLVIHVGDYLYRESACPKGDAGCKGSPHGDNWPTWQADFFAPATPLLAVAPWIVTRGNHEICKRAGAGYFRFLDPALAKNDAPPACTDFTPVYTANVAGRSFIVMDASDADDECRNGCDSARYANEFAGLKPAPGSIFVSHRPIWGIGQKFTLNQTLQQALAAWSGKLPDGIELALAGHMHMFEVLSFSDGRSPQLIVGTGGTKLDKRITRPLKGIQLGGATVSFGRAERDFGFVMLTPTQAGGADWNATFVSPTGQPKFACELKPTAVSCGPAVRSN
jgi:calcineurin-like phosphoesterase family protein